MAPGDTAAPELKELLYLRQFFYQCPAGLFETDDAGIVQMVNPAAVRLLARRGSPRQYLVVQLR